MSSPSTSPAIRHVQVAAGILWNGAEVLIARRLAQDHQGNRWEFPGGKARPGETLEACLKREMREEIDLDVEVGPLWRALTHVYADRRVSIYFHFCTALAGTPRAVECAEVRWVRPSLLLRHEFVEGDVPILPDLVRDLRARAR